MSAKDNTFYQSRISKIKGISSYVTTNLQLRLTEAWVSLLKVTHWCWWLSATVYSSVPTRFSAIGGNDLEYYSQLSKSNGENPPDLKRGWSPGLPESQTPPGLASEESFCHSSPFPHIGVQLTHRPVQRRYVSGFATGTKASFSFSPPSSCQI